MIMIISRRNITILFSKFITYVSNVRSQEAKLKLYHKVRI